MATLPVEEQARESQAHAQTPSQDNDRAHVAIRINGIVRYVRRQFWEMLLQHRERAIIDGMSRRGSGGS